MMFEEFEQELNNKDFLYKVTDLWDFKEHYQNLLSFEENKNNFLNFMEVC